MVQPRPLFVYFHCFQIQFYRKIVDYSGIRTQIVGVKASTLTTGPPLPRPNMKTTYMVSTVVTPRPTLAGEAPLFSQNETHEMMTIRLKKKKSFKVESRVALLFVTIPSV